MKRIDRPHTRRGRAALQAGRRIALLSLLGWLAGCAVGPDYQRPELPATSGYAPAAWPTQTEAAATLAGAAQRLALGQDIRADWWAVFQSQPLNDLIERALAANPTLEAAHAALRIAQENVYAQQGFFYPTVQAGYTASRTKIAGNLGGNSPGVQGNGSVISTYAGTPASEGGSGPFSGPVIYNFHTAQLTVGYTPDVFGANKRQVESLQAQRDNQRYQMEAATITVASNIVAAAIQDALLREQIGLVREMIAANEQALGLVQRQLKAGYAARLDVAAQESALAQARQQLPPLHKQFEQNRDLMRALAGQPQDSEVPAFTLAELVLPQELPLSLPSQLVAQRPDVRAAEELVRSASAQVGVARAARLPQIPITASVGGAASRFGEMFWNSGKFFDLALGITAPIFDGGTLKHRERAADATLAQAAAQYKATLIVAYQNVADALHAVYADAQTLQLAADAEQAARSVRDQTARLHGRGYLDRLALINAEQTWRQGRLTQAQAQAARLGDTALLFQTLGGGWWNRADKTAAGDRTVARH